MPLGTRLMALLQVKQQSIAGPIGLEKLTLCKCGKACHVLKGFNKNKPHTLSEYCSSISPGVEEQSWVRACSKGVSYVQIQDNVFPPKEHTKSKYTWFPLIRDQLATEECLVVGAVKSTWNPEMPTLLLFRFSWPYRLCFQSLCRRLVTGRIKALLLVGKTNGKGTSHVAQLVQIHPNGPLGARKSINAEACGPDGCSNFREWPFSLHVALRLDHGHFCSCKTILVFCSQSRLRHVGLGTFFRGAWWCVGCCWLVGWLLADFLLDLIGRFTPSDSENWKIFRSLAASFFSLWF